MTVNLYPHQQRAVEELSNGKILYGGTGSGKSRVAAAYYMKNEAPRDIYVFTTAVKRDSLDWREEFVRYGVGISRDATTQGVLHVDSWNNIAKYKNIRGAFLILDEQRLVGSGKWVHAFLRMAPHNHWILLSATPGDVWLDYAAVFIANGFYRNITDFKEQHVVYNNYANFPKVDRYVGLKKLEAQRDQLLVEMPYLQHTVRRLVDVPVDYDVERFDQVLKGRWNPYEGRPVRDVAELFVLMRKVVNSDASRVEAIRELIRKHPRLIVFYNFDYELELLRELSNEIEVRERNGHKHQDIPDIERWVYLVQYAAGAEAWNCITTDAMVFYSLTYSYKMWQQAHGRIDRLNTPFTDLWYYRLLSDSAIDKVVMNSLRNKKSFNEAKIRAKYVDTSARQK